MVEQEGLTEGRDKLNAVSGVNDMAPVISEDFIQWVLEDNFVNGRPDWALGGVTLTSNVTPYEEAKIRLLNGSHQMLSYPSFLSGLRRVDIALQVHSLLPLLLINAGPSVLPIHPQFP